MIRSKVHRFGTIQMLALLGLLAIGLTASTAGPALAPNSNTGGMLLAAAQKTGFQALGQMPGAAAGFGTFASGISGDGSTIVGYASVCPNGQSKCTSTDKTEAYRWTVAAGYQVLGDLGSSIGSSASATSSDGSIVVGEAPVGGNSFGAFRWTAAEGMVALPLPMIFANAVTADGRMVAGGDHWWNTSGQTGTFGPFPGQQDQTAAYGLSADGGVAVGAAINGADAFGPTFNAFLWTPAGGLQDIRSPRCWQRCRCCLRRCLGDRRGAPSEWLLASIRLDSLDGNAGYRDSRRPGEPCSSSQSGRQRDCRHVAHQPIVGLQSRLPLDGQNGNAGPPKTGECTGQLDIVHRGRRVGRWNRHHWLRSEPKIGMGTVPNSPSLALIAVKGRSERGGSGSRMDAYDVEGGLLPRAAFT